MAASRFLILPVVLLTASSLMHAQPETAVRPQSQNPSAPASPSPAAPLFPTDSKAPEVVYAPSPDYPPQVGEEALRRGVSLRVRISETGDVERTFIISGDPVLARATADSVQKNWKFKPFVRYGAASKIWVKIDIDFKSRVSGTKPTIVVDTAAPPASLSSGAPATAAASTPSPESVALPQRIRVSQGLMDGLLLQKVEPVYPAEAKRNGIEGAVLLGATIDREGRVQDLKWISGPPKLIEASLDAVRQWRYRPYLINGEPVVVHTTIKIEFHL